MVKKPKDLKSALGKASEPPQPDKKVEKIPDNQPKYPVAQSRIGTRTIAGHFPVEVAIQLKKLAASEDATVQDLLSEALNLLFEKYGEKPIA